MRLMRSVHWAAVNEAYTEPELVLNPVISEPAAMPRDIPYIVAPSVASMPSRSLSFSAMPSSEKLLAFIAAA